MSLHKTTFMILQMDMMPTFVNKGFFKCQSTFGTRVRIFFLKNYTEREKKIGTQFLLFA